MRRACPLCRLTDEYVHIDLHMDGCASPEMDHRYVHNLYNHNTSRNAGLWQPCRESSNPITMNGPGMPPNHLTLKGLGPWLSPNRFNVKGLRHQGFGAIDVTDHLDLWGLARASLCEAFGGGSRRPPVVRSPPLAVLRRPNAKARHVWSLESGIPRGCRFSTAFRPDLAPRLL